MGGVSLDTCNYDLLSHQTKEVHSIEGLVPLYRLKGQSLFLFAVPASSLFAKLASRVQKENHPNLCSYYGNLNKEAVNHQQSCLSGEREDQLTIFWTYHNFTLADKIDYNVRERKYPEQSELWEIIKILCEVATILIDHGIFLDFNFHNIQFSPYQNVEVYWGNAKVGNGHRFFYQALISKKAIGIEGLSPEQLNALSKNKIASKFDMQKCVMHSLGRLLLLYANNINYFQEMINFQKLQINDWAVANLQSNIKKRHSQKLARLIGKMLQPNPVKRLTFSALANLLESQQYKCLIQKVSIKESDSGFSWSPTRTCQSSKVSVGSRF